MFYFLPILCGQKVAVSDSAEGWCAALGLFPSHSLGGQKAAVSDSAQGWGAGGNLGASRVSIRRDDRNGWTEDG